MWQTIILTSHSKAALKNLVTPGLLYEIFIISQGSQKWSHHGPEWARLWKIHRVNME